MEDIEIIERRPERIFGTDIWVVRHDRFDGKSYVLAFGQTGGGLEWRWTELLKNVEMSPTLHVDDHVMKALTEHFQKEHPLPVEKGLREVLETDVEDARETRDNLLGMLMDAVGRIG